MRAKLIGTGLAVLIGLGACALPPGGGTEPRAVSEVEENDAPQPGSRQEGGTLGTNGVVLTGAVQDGDPDWIKFTLPSGTWDVTVTCPSPIRAAAAAEDGNSQTTFASCSAGRVFASSTYLVLGLSVASGGPATDYGVQIEIAPSI